MQDDNIQFDEMPDWGGMFSSQHRQEPIVEEKEYSSLYEELKDKCSPKKFMNPYDAERVSISNQLYQKIKQKKDDEEALSEIRREASSLLGIRFCGKGLYQKLMSFLNPRLYVEPYPYQPDYLEIANKYYPSIEESKDDYVALESIANEQEVIDFIQEIERKQQEREAFLNRENNIPHRNPNEYEEKEIYDIQNAVGENWHKYINNQE